MRIVSKMLREASGVLVLCLLFLSACQTKEIAVYSDKTLSKAELSELYGYYHISGKNKHATSMRFMAGAKDITLSNGQTVQSIPFEYKSEKVDFEGDVVLSYIPNSDMMLASFPGESFKTYQNKKGKKVLSPRSNANETHPFAIMKKDGAQLSVWLWAKDKETQFRKDMFNGDQHLVSVVTLKKYLADHMDDFLMDHQTHVALTMAEAPQAQEPKTDPKMKKAEEHTDAKPKDKAKKAVEETEGKNSQSGALLYEGYVHDLKKVRHRITISKDQNGDLVWTEYANAFSFCINKLTAPQKVRPEHWGSSLEKHQYSNVLRGNPLAGCKDQIRITSKDGGFAKALLISELPNKEGQKKRYKIVVSSSSVHLPYSDAAKAQYGIAEGEIYPKGEAIRSKGGLTLFK